MVKLKVGRYILDINEKDLILDNGACYQIITKEVGHGFNSSIPVISKKLFTDLKKCGLIFTSEELMRLAVEKYNVSGMTYYKFDIEKMKELGY